MRVGRFLKTWKGVLATNQLLANCRSTATTTITAATAMENQIQIKALELGDPIQ